MATNTHLKQELTYSNQQRTFGHDATEAAFLLGGIGTGNVSVGARGEFRDWEIFNSPAKGLKLPYSFFSIWAQEEGKPSVTKILEAKRTPPYSGSHGFFPYEVAGLPRLDSSRMSGEYPFVWVEFSDADLPVDIRMEAFTPFIPLNADDSGIPCAIIRYSAKNTSAHSVEVTIAGSLANAVGFDGYDPFGNPLATEGQQNEYIEDGALKGILFTSQAFPENHIRHGSMALLTTDDRVTHKAQWLQGKWYDDVQDFWDDFREDGRLEPRSEYDGLAGSMNETKKQKIGSLGICNVLAPGMEACFEFILTWHFPNRIKGWNGVLQAYDRDKAETVKNYYATLFKNALDTGKYVCENMHRLEKASRGFHRALFGSTLPWYVLDAAASNITVIRSCTCFRIEDGTYFGWEGCFDSAGCCEGNCTHVWNYAQTLAFLFPELEQSMRRTEFAVETDDDGNMAFRAMQTLGQKRWAFLPAADGQLGTIVRLYRDWKYSGNDDLLRKLWGKARLALEYAFVTWDRDGDFVLESQQHNTYDIEFYGTSSLTNSIFFTALKAASEIEQYLGNEQQAKKYAEAYQAGSMRMDELLWNGEYYVQRLDDIEKYRYQYGKGCLSDQILGQLLAHIAGLGYILPEEHVKSAILSVYKHNFKKVLGDHNNAQRTYALNDEGGLLLCTWPNGGRPKLPFAYCDEVWAGIEYQVAAHLIYEGFVEEGLTVVQAVRERHDGYRRNPWNEVECGHHYVRSMASWAVFLALSGFGYDCKSISFRPKINEDDFSSFFCTGTAWGIYTQKKIADGTMHFETEVLYGSMEGLSSSCKRQCEEENDEKY